MSVELLKRPTRSEVAAEDVYGSHRTCTNSDNLGTRVAHALRTSELAFLQGNFRRSLQASNQCLRDEILVQQKMQKSRDMATTPPTILCVTAALSFALQDDASSSSSSPSSSLIHDETARTFQVRLDSKVSAMDQIAAIALQSWFEIERSSRTAQRSTNTTNDSRNKDLLPFLNLYSCESSSLNACRTITLELMVVFLQFCEAENHIQDALCISLELLTHRFHKDKEPKLMNRDGISGTLPTHNNDLDENYQELLLLFLTRLLPRLHDPNMARRILEERIFNTFGSPPLVPPVSFSASQWRVGTQINVDSASELCEVLSEVSLSLDKETWWALAIDQAKRDLNTILLTKREKDAMVKRAPDSSVPPMNASLENLALVPTQRDGWSITTIIIKLQNEWLQLVKQTVARLSGSSFNEDKNATPSNGQNSAWAQKVAFSLALVLLAWRKNGTVRRVTKALGMMFLSPAVELLEALANKPSHKSYH
jgi:hypothetical protein